MSGYNSTLNTMGDKTHEWFKFIQKWKKNNPPLDNGCYICGICGRFILADEVTLDHIHSRSRMPSLVFDENNIQPAHYYCNSSKGSTYIEPRATKEHYDFFYWMSNM